MSYDLGAVIDNFRAAMRAKGIETSEVIEGDGQLHRFHVEGDRPGSENGWYILHLDDKPAGQFGCNKRYGKDERIGWSYRGEGVRDMTPEERAALKKRQEEQRAAKAAAEAERNEAARQEAVAIWNAATPADAHPYLTAKGVSSHGLRVGRWEKVSRETGEVYFSRPALLVPQMDKQKQIHNLQAVFSEKCLDKGTRDKDYLFGGRRKGLFCPIGKPMEHDGRRVFMLGEGYSTCASAHECTNHMALVCFDTANLVHVARAIRESQPDAIILFLVDNDQWVTQPVPNPGLHYARAAATEVGGLLAVPPFSHSEGVEQSDGSIKGPTDINDLHQRRGADAVVHLINRTLSGDDAEIVPPLNEPDLPPAPPLPDSEPEGAGDEESEYAGADTGAGDADDDDDETPLTANGHFTILGYDGPYYYLFSHEKRQVMSITKRDLTDTGLIELAPVNWWEEHFAGSQGIDKKAAANWLFRTANARGPYNPSRVRGRGAWRDNGRLVYHHGGHLTVDGDKTDITAIRSAYVYPMGWHMPAPHKAPLTDDEGAHLMSVASQVRWSMPASAALMAGWCMLAPICGALSWRPHIWITGPAGSGKSTVQRDFCYSLVDGIGNYFQGNSTEPGIRQELRADALPVLLDEAESNDPKEKQRVESILALIRQASSDSQARTVKGTAGGSSMAFHIRSMFCLASINTNLEKQADMDRLTKLAIRAPSDEEKKSDAHWQQLENELTRMANDETLSARLLARALNMLPVILESVAVFRKVAAKHFGGRQRDGDQLGTLLAGCWCLQKSTPAQEYEAQWLIKQYQWNEHLEEHDHDDSKRALDSVMSAKVRVGNVGELTIYELVRAGHTLLRRPDGEQVSEKDALDALARHGVRLDEAARVVLLGTSNANLKKLVVNTPYATDLRGQLLRIKGADRYNDKAVRFSGTVSKCVAIPLGVLFDTKEPGEAPVPEDEEFPI